jgi:hypothetical protein
LVHRNATRDRTRLQVAWGSSKDCCDSEVVMFMPTEHSQRRSTGAHGYLRGGGMVQLTIAVWCTDARSCVLAVTWICALQCIAPGRRIRHPKIRWVFLATSNNTCTVPRRRHPHPCASSGVIADQYTVVPHGVSWASPKRQNCRDAIGCLRTHF